MKILIRLITVLLFISLGIFLFITISGSFSGFPDLRSLIPNFREVTTQGIIFEKEVRDLVQLETLEYHVQLVFPYDFIEKTEDSTDWYEVRRLWYNHKEELYWRTSPSYYPELAVPPIWKAVEFFDLSMRVGMDIAAKPYQFLVLSCTLRGGIDFSEKEPFFTYTSEGNLKEVVFPGPIITYFSIDDRIPSDEGFPEIPMTPENWSFLITELTPVIKERIIETGFLEKAGKKARTMILELLHAAGEQDVVIQYIQ